MDELLERLQKIIAAYNPRRKDSHMRALRALRPVVQACRQYIKENASEDKGCAERLSRQLDVIISALPDFRHYAEDAHSRHNRRLAEEHLDSIESYLNGIVAQAENKKKDKMREWVKAHPILSEMHHVAVKKPLPKEAYVLVFEYDAEGPQLVTREPNETMVLTRIRPREFSDELHVYKLFHGKREVIGAAVIAQQELIVSVGELPAPAEGKTQLQTLLSISKEAASQPAAEYIEQNGVLKQLHELAREKGIPKDAYVLLFHEDGQLLSRQSSEGRILTRFWPDEFKVKHKLFEQFRALPTIAGAAVVKEKELLQSFGKLPEAADEGQTQLDVLLGLSTDAVGKPAADFLAANEVLSKLHELATGDAILREAYVILFAENAGGRLEMYSTKRGVRFDLAEFRSVKTIFDRFAKLDGVRVVGASVIGEEPRPLPVRAKSAGDEEGKKDQKRGGGPGAERDRERRGGPGAAAGPKFSVLHAFGRTPLKQHLLASAENFRRMGMEAAAPPPPREREGRGHDDRNRRKKRRPDGNRRTQEKHEQ